MGSVSDWRRFSKRRRDESCAGSRLHQCKHRLGESCANSHHQCQHHREEECCMGSHLHPRPLSRMYGRNVMKGAACFWTALRTEQSMMVSGVTGCHMDEVFANGQVDGSTREILRQATCMVAATLNSPMAAFIVVDSIMMFSVVGAHCKVVKVQYTRAISRGGRATGRAVYASLTAVCTRESSQIIDLTAMSRSAPKSTVVWFFSRVYHTTAKFRCLSRSGGQRNILVALAFYHRRLFARATQITIWFLVSHDDILAFSLGVVFMDERVSSQAVVGSEFACLCLYLCVCVCMVWPTGAICMGVQLLRFLVRETFFFF